MLAIQKLDLWNSPEVRLKKKNYETLSEDNLSHVHFGEGFKLGVESALSSVK
jgi:hypothetical protein